MKITIFGASGRTGRELIRRLLERHHEVIAFVRSEGDFPISHDRLNLVRGDLTRLDDVTKAMTGQDAVVSTLGPRTLLTRVPELVTGVRRIVSAMTTCDVRRIVYISALGVGDSERDQNRFFRWVIRPVLLGRDYADHLENESTIRKSGLEWVIVRPARLVDGPSRGSYQVDLRLSATFPFGRIARADVADFIVGQLENPTFVGQAPGLMGFRSFWAS